MSTLRSRPARWCRRWVRRCAETGLPSLRPCTSDIPDGQADAGSQAQRSERGDFTAVSNAPEPCALFPAAPLCPSRAFVKPKSLRDESIIHARCADPRPGRRGRAVARSESPAPAQRQRDPAEGPRLHAHSDRFQDWSGGISAFRRKPVALPVGRDVSGSVEQPGMGLDDISPEDLLFVRSGMGDGSCAD